MTTNTMLGSNKNRGKHGSRECVYGCCKDAVWRDKPRSRRILRRREKQVWRYSQDATTP
jgi:hypothetical protein